VWDETIYNAFNYKHRIHKCNSGRVACVGTNAIEPLTSLTNESQWYVNNDPNSPYRTLAARMAGRGLPPRRFGHRVSKAAFAKCSFRYRRGTAAASRSSQSRSIAARPCGGGMASSLADPCLLMVPNFSWGHAIGIIHVRLVGGTMPRDDLPVPTSSWRGSPAISGLDRSRVSQKVTPFLPGIPARASCRHGRGIPAAHLPCPGGLTLPPGGVSFISILRSHIGYPSILLPPRTLTGGRS